MFEFVLRWFAWGFDASLKAALIATIVAIVLKLLRASDSNIRHRAWAGVLSGMLLLPLLTPFVPALRLPLLPSPEWLVAWTNQPETISPDPEPIISTPIDEAAQPIAPPTSQPTIAQQPPSFRPTDFPRDNFPRSVAIPPPLSSVIEPPAPDIQPAPEPPAAEPPPPVAPRPFISRRALITALTLAAGGIWLTFASILALRLALAVWITASMRRASTAIELTSLLGENTTAKIRECPLIRVPLTVGWLNPHILLPLDWRSWPSDKLHAVLAHEQMHVQRADCLVAFLAELNCCMYWFHPLAWWLKQQLSSLAEQACDDAAIGSTGDRTRYARHLLEVAAAVSQHHSRLSPLGVSMARRSNVETRILAILDLTRPLSQRLSWAKTLALLALLVPLITLAAALQPSSRSLLPEGTSIEAASTSQEEADLQDTSDQPNDTKGKQGEADGGPEDANADKPASSFSVNAPNPTFIYAGTVIDSNDQPVAGAGIRLEAWQSNPPTDPGPPAATTDNAGKFHFDRKQDDFREGDHLTKFHYAQITVRKPGFGIAVISSRNVETTGGLDSFVSEQQRQRFKRLKEELGGTIKLIADDVPIEGQIVNIEGQPVAGALVEVAGISEGQGGSLDKWLEFTKKPSADFWSGNAHLHGLVGGSRVRAAREYTPLTAKTDSEGRFTLRGLGRDRIAQIFISSPETETTMFRVISRKGETIRLLASARDPSHGQTIFYPNQFTHAVGPSRPIEGRVTDKKTGEPLAGLLIKAEHIPTNPVGGSFEASHIRTVTDANGRYRLTGLPLGDNTLAVVPPDNSRYLITGFRITTKSDDKPLTHDVELTQGVIVHGRITDSRTDKPIPGTFQYFVFNNNPHLKEAKGFSLIHQHSYYRTDNDGKYEIPVLPANGILTFNADSHEEYMRGTGFEEVDGPKTVTNSTFFHTSPYYVTSSNFHLLKGLDVAANAENLNLDLTLASGEKFQARLRAADGQPISNYQVFGEQTFGGWYGEHSGESFDVKGYLPEEGRRVMIYHPARNLVGMADVRGPAPKTLDIELRPGGIISGRVIDANGQPLEEFSLYAKVHDFYTGRHEQSPDTLKDRGEFPTLIDGLPLRTDKDGRFEIRGLIPNLKYTVGVTRIDTMNGRRYDADRGLIFTDLTIESGQTKDLGDLKIKPSEPTPPTVQKSDAKKSNSKNPSEPKQPATDQSPKSAEKTDQAPATKPASDSVNGSPFRGRVLSAAGQPVANAKIHWIRYQTSEPNPQPPRFLATTNDAGEFSFPLPKFGVDDLSDPFGWKAYYRLVVTAPGHGFALTSLEELKNQTAPPGVLGTLMKAVAGNSESVIKLPAAGDPIRGRLVNIEGQPLPGVTVKIRWFGEIKPPGFSGRVPNAKNDPQAAWFERVNGLLNVIEPIPLRDVLPQATTNAAGQFELRDVGPDRMLQLLAQGEQSEAVDIVVRNQTGENITVPPQPNFRTHEVVVHPREFVRVIGPSKPFTGRVLDLETSQPIAGAVVRAYAVHGSNLHSSRERQEFATRTDAAGRYKITGLPIGKENRLVAFTLDDIPYVPVGCLADTTRTEDTSHDFRLKRGVWTTGRVYDGETDQPFTGQLEYYWFRDRELEKQYPGLLFAKVDELYWTNANGEYKLPVLPTRGILAFRNQGRPGNHEGANRFSRGFGADSIEGSEPLGSLRHFPTMPHYLMAVNYERVAEVNPRPEQTAVRVDLPLFASQPIRIHVVDADGNAVTGCEIYGANERWGWQHKQQAEFVIEDLSPKEHRKVVAFHRGRNLAGGAAVKHGDAQPVVIKLAPAGSLTGRLLDDTGEPITDATLHADYDALHKDATAGIWANHPTQSYNPTNIPVDDQGRFQLDGLIPGWTYTARAVAPRKLNGQLYNNFSIGRVFSNVRVEPGEKKDLGNVRAKENDADEAKPEKDTPPAKPLTPARSASEGKQASTPQTPSAMEKSASPLPLPLAPRVGQGEGVSVNTGETRSVSGKILLSSNQPATKAHVALIGWRIQPREGGNFAPRGAIIAAGKTDDTGRFQLPLLNASSKTHDQTHLIARAPGSGVVWQKIDLDSPPQNTNLNLQPEQPIRVRLIDLEGHPASGVKVRIGTVLKRSTDGQWPEGGLGYDGDDVPDAWLATHTADSEGRLTIHGVAADCGIFLATDASDRFSPQDIAINTGMPEERGERDGTYRSLTRNAKPGEELVLPLSPAQIFEGTIRYEDTKEPVPHSRVTIWASQQNPPISMVSVEGKTDAAGHYRIAAKPGIRFGIMAYAPTSVPYLIRQTTDEIRWENGDRIKQIDVNLPRGVLVQGQIITTGDKRPVAKAAVQFLSQNSSAASGFKGVVTGWQGIQLTAADGSYQIAVPPIPGHILVNHDTGSFVLQEIGDRMLSSGQPGGQRNYAHAIQKIAPATDASALDLNIELQPGATVGGRIVDQTGEPIPETIVVSRLKIWSHSLKWRGDSTPVFGGRFELKGLQDGIEYPTHFLDPKRKLGATVHVKAGDEDRTVVLLPCGTALARFLDDQGQPLADHSPTVHLIVTPGVNPYDYKGMRTGQLAADSDFIANHDRLNHNDLKTDAAGKLTIPALIPGATYWIITGDKGQFSIAKEFTVQPGQTLDLGDIAQPSTSGQPKAAATTSPPSDAKPPLAPNTPADSATTVRGRVFDEKQQPIAGAKIFIPRSPRQTSKAPRWVGEETIAERATTDADGRFSLNLTEDDRLAVSGTFLRPSSLPLLAYAKGRGIEWVDLPVGKDLSGADGIEFVLRPEQVIHGRLIDSEGQPISGASVSVRSLFKPKDNEKLDSFLQAWKREANMALWNSATGVQAIFEPLNTTTDAAGRFVVHGVADERIATLAFTAPTLVFPQLLVVNRQGFSARDHYVPPPSNTSSGADTQLGESNFTQIGLPDFKLVGRVTGDDGQPLARASVRANNGYHLGLYATTDADGRYEMPGIARQKTVGVYINPPDGSNTLPSTAMVTAASDEREKMLNVVLQRGLVLRGRVVDAATGQGVPAGLKIIPLPENDFVKRPDYTPQSTTGVGSTDAEGQFEFRALPGPGVLMVSASVGQATIGGELRQTYMRARFTPADREKAKVRVDKDDGREWFHRDSKFIEFILNENAVKYVDVTPQSASDSLEIKVDRGKTVDLEFVDVAGQPLPGVLISGITEAWPITATLADPRCTVYAIGSDRPRLVAAMQKERGLSAVLTLTGNETSSVRVTLQPSASLRGRAVDEKGVPLASTELNIDFPETIRELHRFGDIAEPQMTTDNEGRFRIENIIPGQQLNIYSVVKDDYRRARLSKEQQLLTAGQNRDLGEVVFARPGKSNDDMPTAATPKAVEKPAPANTGSVTLKGLVLLPNGEPAAGATIRAAAPLYATLEPLLGQDFKTPLSETKADSAGRFTITFSTQPFGDVSKLDTRWQQIWKKTAIAASLNGYGPAWVEYEAIEAKPQPLTLQLVEDVPIHGRVIDLEGRPLPSVTIKIGDPNAAENEDLSAWLDGVKAGEMGNTVWQKAPRHIESRLIGLPSTAKTDAKGMIEIRGIGRERFVEITLGDENVAHGDAYVVTRPMETLQKPVGLPPFNSFTPVFGADFTFTADPARTVEGIVLDAKTRQPLAGVAVESDKLANYPFSNHRVLKTTTDKGGRFRLVGMPKGAGNRLLLLPNDDQPYFMREIDVPDPVGLGSAQMEIELHRGIWITGRVTDKKTGEPQACVWVHYFPFLTNEFAKRTPEFDANGNVDGDQRRYQTQADGSFRLVGLPGRAIIGANSILKSYRQGVGHEDIDAPKYDKSDWLLTYRNPIAPSSTFPNVMREINPPEDTTEFKADLQLDPGASVKIRPTDAAGNPLTALTVAGLSSRGRHGDPESDPVLSVTSLGPNEVRTVLLHSKEKNLGRIITIGPDEVRLGQIDVQLQPCATVTGRVLLDDGSPLSGLNVEPRVLPDGDFSLHLPSIATDADGRFQATLFPGGTYRLTAMGGSFQYIELTKELTVRPNQKVDLETLKLDKDGKVASWKP